MLLTFMDNVACCLKGTAYGSGKRFSLFCLTPSLLMFILIQVVI